jgi:hypothetical protein
MQLLVCVTLVVLSSLAQASVLNNGQVTTPDSLTPGGTVLGTITGTITLGTSATSYTTSVLSDPGNTFCSGCLDFVYSFTNHGPDINERFSMANFGSSASGLFQVDAGVNPLSTGFKPQTVDRSANGEVIGFNYISFDINPGQSTVQFVIETNAKHFGSGEVSAQDGVAGFNAAFQPSAVPEPSSLAMLGSGLMVVGGFVRKFVKGGR